MKLYFALRADAQTRADDIHAWMVANGPGYGKSVSDGRTARWSIPAQDLDDKGVPLTTEWFIVTKDRCDGAITPTERTALKAGDYKPGIAKIDPI